MQEKRIQKLLDHRMYTYYLLGEKFKQAGNKMDQTGYELHDRSMEGIRISEIEALKKGFDMKEEEIFRQME